MAAPGKYQWELSNPPFYAAGSMRRRLPVFRTASEIIATHRSGDLTAPTKAEQDAKDKYGTAWHMESNNRGALSLIESIRNEGFDTSNPILIHPEYTSSTKPIQEPTIMDGHHRLHGAFSIDPDFRVPVMYTRMSPTRPHPQEIPTHYFEPATEKEGFPKISPNKLYPGNCKACGQRVEQGEGVMVRLPAHLQEQFGKHHVYHPHHLNEPMYSMYELKKRSGLGTVGRNKFRNWAIEQSLNDEQA